MTDVTNDQGILLHLKRRLRSQIVSYASELVCYSCVLLTSGTSLQKTCAHCHLLYTHTFVLAGKCRHLISSCPVKKREMPYRTTMHARDSNPCLRCHTEPFPIDMLRHVDPLTRISYEYYGYSKSALMQWRPITGQPTSTASDDNHPVQPPPPPASHPGCHLYLFRSLLHDQQMSVHRGRRQFTTSPPPRAEARLLQYSFHSYFFHSYFFHFLWHVP